MPGKISWLSGKVVAIAVMAFSPCLASANITKFVKDSPTGKAVKKELLQTALRTVGKSTIRKYLVATQVYDATYSATRAVINAPTYYDAGIAIIDGIQNDKCWAIAGSEVECFGLELDSSTGQNIATASHSQACSFHGSSASANVHVSRGNTPATDYVGIGGHAHAPSAWLTSPSAHWVGLGGVGDRCLEIDSDVLDIVAKIKEVVLDPTPGLQQSWLEAQDSQTEATEQLKDLFSPSGFSLSMRVHLPDATGQATYLFYEGEITAWLTVVDPEATLAADVFGVQLVINAEYFDENGAVLSSLSDSQVSDLVASEFSYFEDTVSIDGQLLDAFGFELLDRDLTFSVDLPDDHDPADPVYVDMEVLAGSAAAGSPIPEPTLLSLLTLGGLVMLRPRERTAR